VGRIINKILYFILSIGFDKIVNRFKIAYDARMQNRVTGRLKACGENFNIQSKFTIINPQYISIGHNFSALYNLRLEAIDSFESETYTPELRIGNNVIFNTDVHIGCIENITIGDNVLLASRIYISDHSHGAVTAEEMDTPPAKRKLATKGPVIIEDNVWIGEGVCILPGVRIGRNAVIGANAVVTKSVPPFSVVAGIPARVIRNLSKENSN
jgi:acetyltransferase-like isoleucine patch superfamily enzyme